jgi:hypothetical protein
MSKVETKALEGILDFLMKSKKPKKAEVTNVTESEPEEATEDVLEEDFEELVETVSPRNKSKKGIMMSISQLGVRKPKVVDKPKNKGKKK